MDKEYKALVNKALERFHFRLNTSGLHAEHAAHDSLARAIRSLYDVAFTLTIWMQLTNFPNSSALQNAENALNRINWGISHEHIYVMACSDYFGGLRNRDYANYSFSEKD